MDTRISLQVFFVLSCLLLTKDGALSLWSPETSVNNAVFDANDRKELKSLEFEFTVWQVKHDVYYSSQEEYVHRMNVFNDNFQRIAKHNRGNHSYTLEANKFADMTDEEFEKYYLMKRGQNCSATSSQAFNSSKANPLLPRAIDWRKKGIVSPVKNQGQCGSCWSFSSTGAMEAQMALWTGATYSLSEQQLIDCSQAFDNHGCNGGLPSHSFEYIKYEHGLVKEGDYAYTAKTGSCHYNPEEAVAFVTDVVNITEADENMLAEALTTRGPVSIAYDVAGDFRFYKSGVYNSTECKTDPLHVNHAVLAVGYDVTKQNVKYWIVKNSWGADWGLDGYFYIEKGKNMCGLADCASYPVVSTDPVL